jgi:hypothetical protein
MTCTSVTVAITMDAKEKKTFTMPVTYKYETGLHFCGRWIGKYKYAFTNGLPIP